MPIFGDAHTHPDTHTTKKCHRCMVHECYKLSHTFCTLPYLFVPKLCWITHSEAPITLTTLQSQRGSSYIQHTTYPNSGPPCWHQDRLNVWYIIFPGRWKQAATRDILVHLWLLNHQWDSASFLWSLKGNPPYTHIQRLTLSFGTFNLPYINAEMTLSKADSYCKKVQSTAFLLKK